MAAVELIYLLAAILWIGVVLAALCLGLRFMVKWRAKRHRINRLLDLVRSPLRLGMFPGPSSGLLGNVNQLLAGVFLEAFVESREKAVRVSRPRRGRPRRGL